MSSDSETDEFYDAEDASFDTLTSPRSSGSTSTCRPSFSKELSIKVSDIEEEERLLLQLKRHAAERRHKEDEELEKRLRELQHRKLVEAQIMEESHAQVNDSRNRRRKLEEMRQLIGEEGSSTKQTNDSSPDEDPHDEEMSNVSQSPPNKKSHTIEKMENSFRDITDNLHRTHSRKKRSGSWGDLPLNTSVLLSYTENERTNDVDDEDDDVNAEHDVQGNFNILVPEKDSEEKLLNQYMSDGENNCELETLKVVDDVMKDSQLSVNAPDIVMSTKTRSSPAVFNPVAPPRRKKSSKSQISPSFDSFTSVSSASPSNLQLPSLLTVDRMGKDFRPSLQGLELRDVMNGSKMVTSELAELDAVKSQGNIADELSLDEGTDEEVFGGSDDERIHRSRKKEKGLTCPSTADKIRSLSPKTSLSEQNIYSTQLGAEKSLTDQEILAKCYIKNLDTGEELPLSQAEVELPHCINPVDLHIVQRTKEFKGDSNYKDISSDDDTISVSSSSSSVRSGTQKKAKQLKKLLSRTAKRVKQVADQVLRGDEGDTEEELSVDGKIFKIKSSNSNKGPYDFAQIRMLQELSGDHVGAIWSMKFSPCGRLLATGGQDGILRIWVLKSANAYFSDLRKKYSEVPNSPGQSEESLSSIASTDTTETVVVSLLDEVEEEAAPFMKNPFCCYRGHAADLLDVTWSKNYFILSSSMDKTVRLWHMSQRDCLCTFQHIDFVTTIVFHPKDDRYFLSGSLDGKLRLWNIPDKKVTLWNEVGQGGSLITTANFVNKGRYAAVGTYDGRCIFYTTEHLKYFTQIHVRSTRGRNAKGHKITGIEPVFDNKMLVTSNDSRIRLYDLRDLTLSVKYKGGTNTSSQIKASLSPSGKYIICGSEDHFIYVWKTRHDFKLSAARRDRNDYWEAMKVHNAVATVAIFAPNPSLFCPPIENKDPCASSDLDSPLGEIIISADFTGVIKVVRNYPQKL